MIDSRRSRFWQLCFLSLLALLAGMAFLGAPGTRDVPLIHSWFTNLSELGLEAGYKKKLIDYPPLFFFTLYPFKWASQLSIGVGAPVKASSLFYLYLSTFIFYKISREILLTAIFFVALFLNVAILKYIDINYTPFLLLAFLFLRQGRYVLFSLVYTITFLIKWQPLILAPFFAIYVIYHSTVEYRRFWNPILLQVICASLAVFTGVLLLFGSFRVLLALLIALNGGFYLSGDALNLHWITSAILEYNFPSFTGGLTDGYQVHDMLILKDFYWLWIAKIPYIAAFGFTLVAFYRSNKTFRDLVYFGFIGQSIYFTLNTGAHENHLFVVVVLALFLATLDRKFLAVACVMAIYLNINLFLFEGFGDGWYVPDRHFFGVDITLLVAIIFTVCNSIYLYRQLRAAWGNKRIEPDPRL